jgi:hypothetical protein
MPCTRATGGDEAESGDEAVQVRREAAEAARGAAADRRRARQRMRAVAVIAVEEEEEDAEAEQQGGPAEGAEEAGALAGGERSGDEGEGAAASATADRGVPSRRKRAAAAAAPPPVVDLRGRIGGEGGVRTSMLDLSAELEAARPSAAVRGVLGADIASSAKGALLLVARSHRAVRYASVASRRASTCRSPRC